MRFPTFDELPYFSRPDLTPYLMHLSGTKADQDYAAYEKPRGILRSGYTNASD